MSQKDNLTIGENIYKYFNENKFEELINLFSENSESFHIPTNAKFTGRDGFRQAALIWKNAFPDSWCEIKNQIVTSEYIITEFNGRGTHNGILKTPMGDFNPTGNKVNLPVVEIMEIKNGLIENYRLYFDSATLMHQLKIVHEHA